MADALRITVEELKRRMDLGEDFTVIDVRNHRLDGNGHCDTRSDSSAAGQTRRKPTQNSEKQTCSGVLHVTKRGVQRQFGARTSAAQVQRRVGASRRIPSVAGRWIAS